MMNILLLSWWLFFANVSTAVLDVESTQSCLQQQTCREGNPLMGTRRWQQYGVKAAILAPLFVWQSKSDSNLPPWILIGSATSQGVMGSLNLRF